MITALGPLATTTLIFGGCCSNVFALEAIVKYGFFSALLNFSSKWYLETLVLRLTLDMTAHGTLGLLITFFQWVFTSSFAYLTQFDLNGPYTVRKPKVPLLRWTFIAAMFYGINMLNNWAFAYNISVPVHIILRSFGSVTTMLAGFLRRRRYSKLQVLSVAILTVGVLVSAWADSESKGKSMSVGSEASNSEFVQGLIILLVAQFLSAFMGAYVEDTYENYKADWTENLFYSHFLSLPLFIPLVNVLTKQYDKLASTAPLSKAALLSLKRPSGVKLPSPLSDGIDALLPLLEHAPQGVLFLLINAVTQLACISGVNLLSAKSSAVTVTIVLNIRKLVSFIFSTLLFGHQLNNRMIIGSVLVFGSGALYGWETSWRLPKVKKAKAKAQANGSLKDGNPKKA